MPKQKQIFQLAPIDLGTVAAHKIDCPLCSFAVEYFDGLDNTVFLQESPDDNDPNAIELTHLKGQSWPIPWDDAYIRVRTAQTGKTLVMTVGTVGTSISPGYKQDTSAQTGAVNRSAITAWEKTVTASETALGTATLPSGYSLVIKADIYNDNANPVRIREDGDSTYFTLYAGEAISLFVSSAAVVIVDSDIATNKLHCIVEQ